MTKPLRQTGKQCKPWHGGSRKLITNQKLGTNILHIPGRCDQWQHLRQLSAGAKVPGLHWIPHQLSTSHLQGNLLSIFTKMCNIFYVKQGDDACT